ncbi:MAG: helix-turn-helix domain protein [Frankiales bacterium]|jgi:transcriptional regulator with XRE-family HTH domain|nr:helix-turn-helix domain protein [Frankiales bacterium]
MASIDVRHLGNYIREQRGASDISLRQLAKLAGVSNPYLSQIERGLRKPSAEILQQIAKGLRISAEAMYVQAGILDERVGDGLLSDAVHADDGLTERQKQVLLEIYESFRKENAAAALAAGDVAEAAAVSLVATSKGLPEELSSAAANTPARAPRKKASPSPVKAARSTTPAKATQTKARTKKASAPSAAPSTDLSTAAALRP